ncbi:unnamed protein product [Citrullus colocynthis]|uniref:Uncharacterized protein n=1 Tax=Citrullus colocynthis TaxID=252529 RepID=A0ABP0YX53_9ROSI
MEGKKVALVVVVAAAMIFSSSLAKLVANYDQRQLEENENGNDLLRLFSDGSNDGGVNYKKDNPRKMMKAAAPPRPSCFGNFCGGGLLPCAEPCQCNIPMGAVRGYCVDF